MKLIIAVLTVCGLVLTALVVAGPARAQDVAYGAIAVGHTAYGESVAYGFAWNYVAKDEATEAALNACRVGGGTNCAERAWFQNGCGALAVDQYGSGQAKSAMTQDQAEDRAVQTCEARGGSGCAVVGSQCAGPGGEAGTWSGSEQVLAAPATDADEAELKIETEAAEERDEQLTREQRVQVQRGLAELGFDVGPADGIFGARTKSAIWSWQTAKGLEATGYLTREQADALGALGQADEVSQAEPVPEGVEPDGQPLAESEPQESSGTENEVLYFPLCRDLQELAPDNAGCWKEIANREDCVFFLPRLYLGAVSTTQVTWSGSCQHNAAHGKGKLEYDWEGFDFSEESGEFVEGKKQGTWISRWRRSRKVTDYGDYGTEEQTSKGPYVGGLAHGHWSIRYSFVHEVDGGYRTTDQYEGSIVDGSIHGRWVNRSEQETFLGATPSVRTYFYECHGERYLSDCKIIE